MSEEEDKYKLLERSLRKSVICLPDNLIIGLSGGADSVALLLLLHEAGKDTTAVHCNFHLRGEEADRDAEFCQGLCESLKIPLLKIDFDTIHFARKHKLSIEEACRILRYDKFRQIKNENGAARIAVAHHADDNIETLMLNLMRGAGIKGLKGMISDNGEIVRPLLPFFRKDIELFLRFRKQSYVTDSTNLENDVSRNFIRNSVIPLLESRWPSARKSISQSITNLQRAYNIYDDATMIFRNPDLLPWSKLESASDTFSAIHEFLSDKSVGSKIESEVTMSAINRSYGSHWDLTDGNSIWLTSSGICHINDRQQPLPSLLPEKYLKADFENNSEEYLYIPQYVRLIIREADPDERIRLKHGSKPVGEILKERGVPLPLRRHIPVVAEAESNEILWLPFAKRSSRFLIKDGKSGIMKISLSFPPYYIKFFREK